MNFQQVQELNSTIRNNVGHVIIGKEDLIDLMTVAMLCSGHILLQDVPGTGKTVLAKSLAKSLDAGFSRVQFTPDLMPSDLTGIHFYNQKEGSFTFRPGPLMNQIILADEINRATPRTQSALLEAMAERQITVDGQTMALEEPFMVIATQNPVETKGTFPLPEAQLDRFFMQLSMGYPSLDQEMHILKRFKSSDPLQSLQSVATAGDLVEAKKLFENMHVSEAVMEYMILIVQATRNHAEVELGISPRGSMALFQGVQAYAALQGRTYVIPDDVKKLAVPILAHRLILNADAYVTGKKAVEIIDSILHEAPVPLEERG